MQTNHINKSNYLFERLIMLNRECKRTRIYSKTYQSKEVNVSKEQNLGIRNASSDKLVSGKTKQYIRKAGYRERDICKLSICF